MFYSLIQFGEKKLNSSEKLKNKLKKKKFLKKHI